MMKMIRSSIAFLLALMIMAAPLSTALALPVESGEEAAQAAGLVPDDLLGREGETIRRADFLRLAVGLYDALGGNTPDHSESGALLRAYQLGIIDGPESDPDGPIVRQDAYVLTVRTIDLAVEEADVSLHANFRYADEWQIAGEAKSAVDYLFHHRLIGGHDDYVIAPRQELLIGEAVALVYNVYAGQERLHVRTEFPDEWEWHIEPVYDGLVPDTRFSNGLAAVSRNGKYGYIDREGRVAIEFLYDRAYEFSEGLARVERNGKIGYIDRQGQVVIPFQYDKGGDFSEGYVWIFDGEAYGFANRQGEVVIPPQYEYAYDFKEGVAPVKSSGKYGYINPNGETVIPFRFDWASSFSEGLARTGSRGIYNYIDHTGNIALEVNYHYLFDFVDGRAIVFHRDQYAVIDKAGNFLIPFGSWGFIFGFHEGLSMVHGDSGYEGNYSYINTDGEIVIGGVPLHDATDFSEGLAAVMTHTKSTNKVTRSYMTKTGELILPKRAALAEESPYDGEAFYLQSFSEGLAAVVTWEGKLGFVENPLLRMPVRGEAELSGPDRVTEDMTYTLTYGLRAAKNISAQEVTITYDSDLLELTGDPVILAPHTMLAGIDRSEPGRVRLKLATLGAANQLRGDAEVLELQFTGLADSAAGAAIANVSAVLADGQGNEFAMIPAWKRAGSLAGEPGDPDPEEPGQPEVPEEPGDSEEPEQPGEPGDTEEPDDSGDPQHPGTEDPEQPGAPSSGQPPATLPPPDPNETSHELGSVTMSNGAAVLTVSEEKLLASLQSAEEYVVVDLSALDGSSIKTVILPPASVRELEKQEARLLVRVGSADYMLPASLLLRSADEQSVKLTIDEQAVQAPAGLIAITPALRLSVEENGQVVTAAEPAERMEIAFRLHDASGDLRKAGVYKLHPATGEWVYAGGRWNPGNRTLTVGETGSGLLDAVLAVFIYDKSFSDVREHWAKDAVEVLASRHIVFGIDETSFAPEGWVSRAEFAALLVRMLGLELVPYGDGWADVGHDDWYADIMETATRAGILMGDGEGRVRPSDPITRQEMAVMLIRVANILGIPPDREDHATFADSSDIASWAREAVQEVNALGWMKGRTGQKFAPQDLATRAEAAQVVYRLLEQSGAW